MIYWIDSNTTESKSKIDKCHLIKLKSSYSTKETGSNLMDKRRYPPTTHLPEIYMENILGAEISLNHKQDQINWWSK